MKIIRIQSLALSVALSLLALSANAQERPKIFGKTISPEKVNPENGLIRCASTEYEEYLQEQNPQRQTRAQFEEWLAPKIEAAKAQRMSTPPGTSSIITIPVVVHVIHNGDAIGSNENIADAQVLSQITVLNQDFRRQVGTPGYNTNPVGADVEIEFCLAQVDPSGNPTNGINRVNLGQASWDSETNIENNLKPATQWDPNQYFNIWVCNFGGGMSDILGYAQFPSNSGVPGAGWGGGASTDGVIIGYQYFGSSSLYPAGNYQWPYNRGRTTTHEIGHCLGLIHVDGDNGSCTVNGTDSQKDYCPDTPAISSLNYVCNYSDSCPASPGADMIENYMDYTPDSCMNIFTQDQKERMQTVMQNALRRQSLLTSNVCLITAGSQDFELLNGINLYPNPAQNMLNINAGSGLPDAYTIYNNLGQVVASVKVASDAQLAVNVSGYSNGIYFIKVEKGNQTKTLKFIKN